MTKRGFILLLFICLFIPGLTQAQTGGIPSTLGWYEIPNTKLRSVCPPNGFGGSGYAFADNCWTVLEAWNSAAMDTARNRLIIWGGGHSDYSGNEIYALDLNTLSIVRLTDPGVPVATSCPESIANGSQPNSRHTYDGIEYIPNVDRLWIFGGSLATCGFANQGTWTFSFSTNQWEKRNPTGTIPRGDLGIVSAYDPNTGKVFVHDSLDLYTYDFSTNSYQRLTNNGTGIDYHMTAAIDPKRKKLVIVGGSGSNGGGVVVYDIAPGSNYTRQRPSTSGGSAIISTDSPGIAYDPVSDRMVAWSGGNSVYSLNLDTNTWTAVSYSSGPTAVPAGTFGRWQYSPTSNVFVTINDVDLNARTFRLNNSSTTSPTAPTVLLSANPASVISGTSSTLTWSTTNASSCTASGGWSGTKAISGSQVVSPTSTTVYSITCTGSGGNATQPVSVTITPSNPTPPPPSGVLQVGPGKQYNTISGALAAAQSGSVIEIDAGVYNESFSISKSDVTLRGVNGYAHLNWGTGNYLTNTSNIPNGKGLMIISGSNVTIENFEFSGAKVVDENGAGIRYEGGDLTIRKSYFHDNENGILGEGGTNNTLTIENSVFERNGYCPSSCAHNVYIGQMGRLIFRYNKSIDAHEGHPLKSRAYINEVISNFLSTKNSDGSYESDFPNGGTVYFIGNVVEQGANTGNPSILAYGAEGVSNPNPALYVINNTFYNYRGSGTFIQVSGSPALSVKNNIFAGGGTVGVSADNTNKTLTSSSFVNAGAADYHLTVGSAAIDAGTNPGTAGSYVLTPQWEYVEPANEKARVVTGANLDSGAFEYSGGTPVPPDTTAPAAPTGLTIGAVSSSQINLSWTASTDNIGVTGYRVERCQGATCSTFTQIATPSSTSYQDAGLTSNTSYRYRVSATDAAGNLSGYSSIVSGVTQATTPPADTTAPAAPTSLTVAAVSFSQINLSWTASTDNIGVTGYRVERCQGTSCSTFTQIATPSSTSYQDAGLTSNTSYRYRVSATDAAGNLSGYSSIVSAVTQTQSTTPPPTASGSHVTSFQLTSPIGDTLPFTVGLGFKKGDVPGTPALDLPTSQVIVKRRWNDGSVKTAIASGRAALAANMPFTIGVFSSSVSSGTDLTAADIQAANPSASVQLGSIGTVSLSSLLASPFRTWISGPEMVEAHYRSSVGSDPTLQVWFYVRLYKNNRIFVRTVVENGYLDVSTNNKTYVPTITIGGAVIYNNGGGSLTHYAHTRWTQEGWIGGDPQITPLLDTNYLIATKLVPNYLKLTPSATALNNLYQSYVPMQNGGWSPAMGDTGFQNQIGLLPLWDALYISSGGDARAYRSLLANAKALSSYAIVWNDSATKLPTIPSNRPTWTTDGIPNGGGNTTIGAGSLTWDVAHHGSGGYLAYLITGDYYYLETMEDQSATCFLINSSALGAGTSRIFGGQTRAVAWCKRTIGQLAAIGPADAITSDYQSLLSNNAAYWNTKVQQPGQNLVGYLYSYEHGDPNYGTGRVSPWQQHFWVQTYGFISDLEPFANMTAWNTVRDFVYKSIVGILGPVGTDNYCYTRASEYTIQISADNNHDPTSWYDSWGQVYQGTIGAPDTSCGTTLQGSSGGDPLSAATGYWGNLLPAIAYAVDHGATGAAASWTRLSNASNWSTVQNSFDSIPIWGIVPRNQPSSNTVPVAPTALVVQ